ncbi:uncharacterized protein LOC144428267 [Styela clava]
MLADDIRKELDGIKHNSTHRTLENALPTHIGSNALTQHPVRVRKCMDFMNLSGSQVTNAHRASRQLPPLKIAPTTFKEMKAFLGLVIAKGIVRMSVVAMDCRKKHSIFIDSSFGKIMPRDIFHSMSKFLHFCNEADAPSPRRPCNR